MKCVHLIACRDVLACSVHDKPYVPSLFDLGVYCKSIDHMDCPLYLKETLSQKPVRSNTEKSFSEKKGVLS